MAQNPRFTSPPKNSEGTFFRCFLAFIILTFCQKSRIIYSVDVCSQHAMLRKCNILMVVDVLYDGLTQKMPVLPGHSVKWLAYFNSKIKKEEASRSE